MNYSTPSLTTQLHPTSLPPISLISSFLPLESPFLLPPVFQTPAPKPNLRKAIFKSFATNYLSPSIPLSTACALSKSLPISDSLPTICPLIPLISMTPPSVNSAAFDYLDYPLSSHCSTGPLFKVLLDHSDYCLNLKLVPFLCSASIY